MPDARPTATPTIALVLGGGGPVGIAWLSGLAIGLRDAGIDLALADRIIGTSAGAVVGSALASGIDIANADLAVGHEVIVILEPLAHVYPRTRADRELGPAREISIRPDDIAVAAFGTDLFADTALNPAYEPGVRQAAAAEPKEFWPAAPATGQAGSDHARTAGGA
ncbi:hypothetical protein [Nocardia sp. NPDC002869]|uniref:hypothetical protein n=1 Tax=Nocardia sp. NPDC002869 TaxID=3161032 RepID=UPI00398D3CD5